MAVNAVAPWEGELVWVGDVVKGESRNGNVWKSVEFTLKYQDSQMNEKFITFSIFGKEKVEYITTLELGVMLRVTWWPESNQGKNGRYYSKNSVINVGRAQEQPKSAETKITAPNYPQPQPPLPTNPDNDDLPDDEGLPF